MYVIHVSSKLVPSILPDKGLSGSPTAVAMISRTTDRLTIPFSRSSSRYLDRTSANTQVLYSRTFFSASSWTLWYTGTDIMTKMEMIATTARSSNNVKPARLRELVFVPVIGIRNPL